MEIITTSNVALAPVLAAIHAQVFAPQEQWGAYAISQLLALPGVFACLAHDSGPCGFILLRNVADEAEILTFAVIAAQRRRGVGEQLLRTALCSDKMAGARSVFLEVSPRRRPALALYEKLGFTRVGLRRCYYADGSDAYVMQRHLPLIDTGTGATIA